MTILAATSWPDAAIAIAGIGFVTVVLSVLIWQIFSTGKLGLAGRHDKEYRKLVDELAAVQRETTAELQRANDALAHLRTQIAELEQGLKEVDRVLKAVE
jgi:Na+-transporting methylmalonyl-CoA/oxaloacetate decarboxylase gamma subunit